MRTLKIVFFLLPVVLTWSCASQSVIPPEWVFEKNGIWLRLKADSQLNMYQGSPHTLYLCVYQLRDPNAFNDLVRDEEGLAKLLECSRFDSSVANAHNFTIHPGEKLTEPLDRAEGAKYVGLVAGYYSFEKENMTRLFEIPVVSKTTGWIRRTKKTKPGLLNINLYFGAEEMKKSEVQ